ncbi:hypothetical protein AAEU33_00135 [Chryseobacterium sp. Chry.R1]|uniref:hypothetical protein n=1 Tax=Chryseobacterium sp. Chry.R1 TaxID=3139392 RepID=UPI0031F844B3
MIKTSPRAEHTPGPGNVCKGFLFPEWGRKSYRKSAFHAIISNIGTKGFKEIHPAFAVQ